MSTFRIPYTEAESEFTEKRSRFIGHVFPVETEEAALECIRRIKSRYYDARHNCWCYRIGQSVVRYSDDGEPQGTAGQPMLKVFERENVTNVCCVVTRYFGGILLGAGGLTRAYSRGAKDALCVAGAATMGEWSGVTFHCAYPLLERVKLELAAQDGVADEVAYGVDICVQASVPSVKLDALQVRLRELSAGSIELTDLHRAFRPGGREEIR